MSDIIHQFEEAAKRLEKRGSAPPWTDHPNDLHMALYVAGELSSRVRYLLEEHLKICNTCKKPS